MSSIGHRTVRRMLGGPPNSTIEYLEQLIVSQHNHLVCVDEESRELTIFRVDETGKQTLFTRVSFPSGQGWSPALENFAKQMGENILMDSPSARRMLEL